MIRRTLVIGLGNIGMLYDYEKDSNSQFYTHAKTIYSHPRFELLGAVDPDSNRRSMFESKYKAPAFDFLHRALQDLSPDLVVIATPANTHFEVFSEVVSNKHVRTILCEKPFSTDPQSAREMVELAELYNVQLFVNYMRRADPGFIEIRKRIETAQITLPIKGTCWYSKGLFNNGSHLFNLLEFWIGKLQTANILSKGREWGEVDPEPDFHVTYDGGSVVFQSGWEEHFTHNTIELVAKSGRLRVEDGGHILLWQGIKPDSNFSGYNILDLSCEKIESELKRYQWNVFEMLDKAISGFDHTLCTGAQALQTLMSLNQIASKLNRQKEKLIE